MRPAAPTSSAGSSHEPTDEDGSLRAHVVQALDDFPLPKLDGFEASCFDGRYITGDIDEHYLDAVEGKRGGKGSKSDDDGDGKASQQLVLQLATDAQD